MKGTLESRQLIPCSCIYTRPCYPAATGGHSDKNILVYIVNTYIVHIHNIAGQ